MFANDAALFFQPDLDNLSMWLCQNRLGINNEKCEAVVLGRVDSSEI